MPAVRGPQTPWTSLTFPSSVRAIVMRAGKVVDRLLRFGPPLVGMHGVPACILSTAITIDTLQAFDITAAPLAVDVWGSNPAAWDLQQELNFDTETWRRFDAFVLSTRSRPVEDMPMTGELGEASLRIPGRKWVGHLITHAPDLGLVIDLELHRLARPARRLTLPDSGAFAWPAGSCDRQYPCGDCRLRYCVSGDLEWASSPDWTGVARRRPIVDRLVRAIRAGHP